MKKIIFIILFLLVASPVALITANEIPPTNQTTTTIRPVIQNPLKIGNDIPTIIEAIMRGVVMPLASILVVVAILYSGFKFVIAQGNPTEIQKAKEGLIWVLVGSAVLLGAYGIAEFLKGTINQIVTTRV